MVEKSLNIVALFEKTRKRLQRYAGITPASAPRGFTGELRPYQKEGLGWFKFHEEFDFGFEIGNEPRKKPGSAGRRRHTG